MALNTSSTKRLSLALTGVLLTGCAASPYQSTPSAWQDQDSFPPQAVSNGDRAAGVSARDKSALIQHGLLTERQRREAYEQGVRDTLQDFKGRMRAQAGFTYEPPLVEVIDMPARQVNGAIIPGHKTPVIIRRGRWVEHNGVALPEVD